MTNCRLHYVCYHALSSNSLIAGSRSLVLFVFTGSQIVINMSKLEVSEQQ